MYPASFAVIVLGLVVFLNTPVTGTTIHYYKCPKVTKCLSELKSVDVTPCPTEPCDFPHGVTVNSTIEFIPTETVTDGRISIYGILHGVNVSFPLSTPNLCSHHNVSCPLKEGVPVYLTISLPISKFYPDVELVAEFVLKDQHEACLFCFEMSCKIGAQKEGVTFPF